jgi:hypothetical protein
MSYIGNDLRSGRSETYVFTASGDEKGYRWDEETLQWTEVQDSGLILE